MAKIKTALVRSCKNQTLVLFLFKEDSLKDCVPAACKALVPQLSKTKGFSGEKGEKVLVAIEKSEKFAQVVLIGLGERKDFSQQTLMVAIGETLKYAASYRIPALAFLTTGCLHDAVSAEVFYHTVVEVVALSSYSFAKYKTRNTKDKKLIKECLLLAVSDTQLRMIKAQYKKALIIAQRVCAARDLINEPPNELTPQSFARRLQSQAQKIKLSSKKFDLAMIKKKKMGGLLAVARGSANKPAFVILHHKGSAKKSKKTICLVGKGVCFDSGGLSLKPAMSMITMKYDMAGAATCAQAVMAAHELNVKHDVVALLPLCENSPDGNAYRPGDVVKTLSGLNVEIFNTDAEGRMILADALFYSETYEPDVVIDVATLTGAAKVCLGDKAAAVLGTSEELIRALIQSGSSVGERLWQLPLWSDYQDDLKSDVADMKNIGLKGAGTITAAKFLSNFVPNSSWAHLDVASMAWEDEGKAHSPKGASGFGVRLLVEYLLSV